MYFIDLFAGAGGLSEGFVSEGFIPIAHVEMDKNASQSLLTRTAYHYLVNTGQKNIYTKYLKKEIERDKFYSYIPNLEKESVINETISDETIDGIFSRLDSLIERKEVPQIDLVIGGPPCQAYSVMGRSRDPHGKEFDHKNYLYQQYIKFLVRYKPKMFVFENVVGLESAGKGKYLAAITKELGEAGYVFDKKILNSKHFNVLQNRRRVILIGWKKGLELGYPDFEENEPTNIIWDLLKDLPPLSPGEKYQGFGYRKIGYSSYLKETGIRKEGDILTWHETRTHLERDLNIYRIAVELWNNDQKRLKYNELPKELITHNNTKSFLDRFKVVAGDLNYSHTMVAHIAKDGHHFIHPDINQNRSLSVREAARIQSFPDDFFFEGPRTSVFTQIGNAVPPLMGKGIAKKIKKLLLNK